jgi:hypothetical protein
MAEDDQLLGCYVLKAATTNAPYVNETSGPSAATVALSR